MLGQDLAKLSLFTWTKPDSNASTWTPGPTQNLNSFNYIILQYIVDVITHYLYINRVQSYLVGSRLDLDPDPDPIINWVPEEGTNLDFQVRSLH